MKRRLTLTVILLAGLGVILVVDHFYRAQIQLAQRQEMDDVLDTAADSLEDGLQRRLDVLRHLKAFMLAGPELPSADAYNRFCAELLAYAPSIRALQYVAPDRTIQWIYPLAGNEEALNLDLMTRPRAAPFVELAISERRLTVNEPGELVQGPIAIVAREPLFRQEQFLGLVQAVIEVESLLDNLTVQPVGDYEVQVWDADGERLRGGGAMAGETMSAEIPLTDYSWRLTVGRPVENVPFVSPTRLLLWLLASFIIGNAVVFVRRSWLSTERLEKEVAVRTEQLQESERRYRMVVENAADAITISDSQGQFLDVNTSGVELLGYSREELRQLSLTDVISDADLARKPIDYGALSDGQTIHQERKVRQKGGNEIDAEISARMLPDGRILGILRDITRRNEAERALRLREAILRSVSFSAERLLRAGNWREQMQSVLERLGAAARVSRAYIFKNHTAVDGVLLTSQEAEWVAPGISPQIDNQQLQGIPYEGSGLEAWAEVLQAGEMISGPVAGFSAEARSLL